MYPQPANPAQMLADQLYGQLCDEGQVQKWEVARIMQVCVLGLLLSEEHGGGGVCDGRRGGGRGGGWGTDYMVRFYCVVPHAVLGSVSFALALASSLRLSDVHPVAVLKSAADVDAPRRRLCANPLASTVVYEPARVQTMCMRCSLVGFCQMLLEMPIQGLKNAVTDADYRGRMVARCQHSMQQQQQHVEYQSQQQPAAGQQSPQQWVEQDPNYANEPHPEQPASVPQSPAH